MWKRYDSDNHPRDVSSFFTDADDLRGWCYTSLADSGKARRFTWYDRCCEKNVPVISVRVHRVYATLCVDIERAIGLSSAGLTALQEYWGTLDTAGCLGEKAVFHYGALSLVCEYLIAERVAEVADKIVEILRREGSIIEYHQAQKEIAERIRRERAAVQSEQRRKSDIAYEKEEVRQKKQQVRFLQQARRKVP